jgi:ribosomal-protein-alanine N-acetyltransferase
MIRRDMPEVCAIENASFEFPWLLCCPESLGDSFVSMLHKRRCIGMVAEDDKQRIVGYMVYETLTHSINILNFAVAPERRRQGVGRQMVTKLVKKLTPDKNRIRLKISERNISALHFFAAMGFRATGLSRLEYLPFSEDDAVRMVYRYRRTAGAMP